jgi:hypothetical protein
MSSARAEQQISQNNTCEVALKPNIENYKRVEVTSALFELISKKDTL